MATTSVKVALRLRPLTAKELLEDARECISQVPGESQIIIGTDRKGFLGHKSNLQSFSFDNVFEPQSSQFDVYTSCAQPLVQKFLEGFNATILAYGQASLP